MIKHIFFGLAVFSTFAFAVSMNFSGNFRTEGVTLSNVGQKLPTSAANKQYFQGRFLLDPNLVIDDHFSIKSQWNLINSRKLTNGASTPLGIANDGWVYGDTDVAVMTLTKGWLEWTSDFGVVRLGRMPITWGYGLLWDAGNGIWDRYSDVRDRLEYRLHLGHVVGAVAYSKFRKESTVDQTSDQDFYTIYLQYDNPEVDVEGGILYEKQSRSESQGTTMTAGAGNPYALPAGYTNPYPLAANSPYPHSNNVLDAYLRKSWGGFTVGGELTWLKGDSFAYKGGALQEMDAWGAIFNVSYQTHKIKMFTEFLYAGGDNNLSDADLKGFVLLNRNRSPGLILGKELLGPYSGNGSGLGTYMAYSSPDTFSGVYYVRPGFRIDWSPAWASGLEVIHARKAAVLSGEDAVLGTEIDVGTDYNVYKNFDLGGNFGVLFPGKGIQVTDPQTIFGFRMTSSLRF